MRLTDCAPVPVTLPTVGSTRGIRHQGRDPVKLDDLEASAVLPIIDDGGHTCPGGAPIPLVAATTRTTDAEARL